MQHPYSMPTGSRDLVALGHGCSWQAACILQTEPTASTQHDACMQHAETVANDQHAARMHLTCSANGQRPASSMVHAYHIQHAETVA